MCPNVACFAVTHEHRLDRQANSHIWIGSISELNVVPFLCVEIQFINFMKVIDDSVGVNVLLFG